MRRMHLRKKVKCKKINNLSKKLLLIFIIFIIMLLNLHFYKVQLLPLLMNYAENKIQEVASSIVTNSLNEKLLSTLKTEELFIIKRDNGEIKTIDFNPVTINKIIIDSLTVTRKLLNKNSNMLKNKIPIGSIFDNPLFNGKGPKITIVYEITNDLSANLNNKITPYGINNVVIETFVNMELVFNIVLPMSTKKVKSNVNIPISIKIIEGEVPDYYLNGYNENSSILSLPIK